VRLLRKCSFVAVELWHDLLRRGAIRRYRDLLGEIEQRIVGAGIGAEIGFGTGTELAKFLRNGANLFGLDLSPGMVDNFKARHPEHAHRVRCGTDIDEAVDLVYSNALFEHLDEPTPFLDNIRRMLRPGGTLILRLPMIANELTPARLANDINLWIPCHRALYTIAGLRQLLGREGFRVIRYAGNDYLGYRVMSRLKAHGYVQIEAIRDPFVDLPGLDDLRFAAILIESLFVPTACLDFAVLAERA
jgi:SAM-dependent methyltransferase